MSIEEITTEIETEEIESEACLEGVVQLIIHPNTNIPWLFRFIDQLNGILFHDDIRGTIVRIVPCFNRSTSITLMLQTLNISNLVMKLAFMPNVTKVVEDSPSTLGFSCLPKRIRLLIDSSITLSKTLHLILEDALPH